MCCMGGSHPLVGSLLPFVAFSGNVLGSDLVNLVVEFIFSRGGTQSGGFLLPSVVLLGSALGAELFTVAVR